MMGKVVYHRHAVGVPHDFQAPLDTFERPQSFREIAWRNPEITANRNRSDGIPHVVNAEEGRGESAK
jgi:hypothetical protein